VKPYSELTHRGQIQRLRRAGAVALGRFGKAGPTLTKISHIENTTFRVDVPGEVGGPGEDQRYTPGRYLLRIHRPGYQNASSIASELTWLAALRRDSGIAVPDPVRTLEGEFLTRVYVDGAPEQRFCSLLRWMDGRFQAERPALSHFDTLGEVMGRLRRHAEAWAPPDGFSRARWDWDAFFVSAGTCGETYELGWDLLGRDARGLFGEVAARTAESMKELGERDDAFGLIHADLHLGNVLFHGGEARVIDFDDCGRGHWIYDPAVLLSDYRRRSNWEDMRDALVRGYERACPFPEDQLRHLETFMNARAAMLILWAGSQTDRNPYFREHLAKWTAHVVDYLKQFHRT
jgi:Ser/Thr protein kinase RdoA (MazF antagonist)